MAGSIPFHTVTNEEIYVEIKKLRDDVGIINAAEVITRLKSLEFKFYAVLAGLVASIGANAGLMVYVIAQANNK